MTAKPAGMHTCSLSKKVPDSILHIALYTYISQQAMEEEKIRRLLLKQMIEPTPMYT